MVKWEINKKTHPLRMVQMPTKLFKVLMLGTSVMPLKAYLKLVT